MADTLAEPTGESLTYTFADSPLIPTLVRKLVAADWMAVELVPSMTPARQPRRAASLRSSVTIQARPISMRPSTIRKNTGATKANSTSVAPRRGKRETRHAIIIAPHSESDSQLDEGSDDRGKRIGFTLFNAEGRYSSADLAKMQ